MKKNKEIFSPFVEQIFEENENLHIIAFKKDAVLAVDKKTNKAHFFYDVSNDTGLEMSFHFDLLSECNDYFASWFRAIIKKLNYKLDITETRNDYYNTLISPLS